MTNPEPEQEPRSRRRSALLWCVSVVVVAALLAVGALALTGGGSTSGGAVDAGGTGTAPVLDSPPVDIDASAQPDTAAGGTESESTTSLNAQTRNAEGGAALVPTPRGTNAPAALGPPREHGVNLVMSSTLSAPLRPGVERTLSVSVRNPNAFPVDLYRVDVRVDAPPAADCLASWVRTGHYRYTTGTPRQVEGKATVVVNLPIELVNLADVDQNACQSTAFPLRLSGIAVDPS
jgi:hypothetical protein